MRWAPQPPPLSCVVKSPEQLFRDDQNTKYTSAIRFPLNQAFEKGFVRTMAISKTRGGSVLSSKPKNSDGDQYLILARGLSSRYTGANTPLVGLTSDEMERDLRHMEAFSNACIAYSQQFYIYKNTKKDLDDGKSNKSAVAKAPLIAMPVRIDPEEEKRLANLKQKIQQCEAQREVLESQYLSLRAHYVYLSKKLKAYRGTVTGHVKFLQEQVQKRGRLVALQRVRLQISREVLAALVHRQGAKSCESDDGSINLVEVWDSVEEKFKKAEKEARSPGLHSWHAMTVPEVPPGVPLLLSQLAKQPSLAAAWSTGGMLGSKKDTLCWMEPLVPQSKDKSELTKDLQRLRKEVEVVRRELNRERDQNRDLQSETISRRQKNDQLVSMMALLRTETEAVVSRHNVLLQSDAAREAADRLLSEEEAGTGNEDKNSVFGGAADARNRKEGQKVGINDSIRASKRDDPESYGDDERGDGEDDDGEMEGSKRSLDGENAPPRSKRRKL